MKLSWFSKKAKPAEEKTAAVESADENRASAKDCERAGAEGIERDAAVDEASESEIAGTAETGYFRRLRSGLARSRQAFSGGLEKLFAGRQAVDADLLEDLEELLIAGDVGVRTAGELVARVAESSAGITDPARLKALLRDEIRARLPKEPQNEAPAAAGPRIVMVVGVNGVGKTTTIGKLAGKATGAGKKVLIAAADTFRAAAVEQLVIWSERSRAEIVKHKEGADPAAVTFDALEAAQARGMDLVLVDTAGRLHTKVNLMEELKKIKRTISRKIPGAPHEILLVVDATTGQNALAQARMFKEALDITAIAVTKLDGSAKGGIVISICDTLKIPLKYVGVGEKIADLQDFDPARFVDALF